MGGALPGARGRAARARAGRAGLRPVAAAGDGAGAGRAVLRGPEGRRRGAPAGDDALAVTRGSSRTSPTRARSRRSSRSCSPRRSTRTRSSGGRRRPRPSSRASCSTGWRSCSGCLAAGTGTSRTPLRRPPSSRSPPPASSLRASGSSSLSEHAHSSVEKAVKIARSRAPQTPVDDAFRLRPDALDLEGACAVVATVGHDLDRIGRSGARDRRRVRAAPACGSTSTPPTPGRRWCARSCGGRSRASIAPTRSSSTRTSGCSCRSTARCSGADGRRRCARPSRSFRSTCARRDAVDSLGEYGPALGRRFRSLKLWAVLRCYGREGLQRLIREHVRLAELFEGWVRAEPGWEVSAPRHFSLVCFRRDGSDEENEALLERVNASGRGCSSRTRSSKGGTCCGSRSVSSGRRRTTCGTRGRCCAARPPASEPPGTELARFRYPQV